LGGFFILTQLFLTMTKISEWSSYYDALENMSTSEILKGINKEDQKIAKVVESAIPVIQNFVDAVWPNMLNGGRLFYVGAGTSGRLGIVDASECPPTFGVPHELVVGIIAGGDKAIRKAVEHAEDDTKQGWEDLKEHEVSEMDAIVGIAASGTTPYVIGAIKEARKKGLNTACITVNPGSPLVKEAEFAISVPVGPEFITGSSRMKAGTAQKLVLNMISSTIMIKLGRVKGNQMVDMQLSNNKLIDRGTLMVMEKLSIDYQKANELLTKYGSVRKAIDNYLKE
jgi:N-acetylmuramic acid 6-phosphate etherase